jgi:hypothetical protein
MFTLMLHFKELRELQEFLEKFPDSKKYLEITEKKVGQRNHKTWTAFEDEHLICGYQHKSAKLLADELFRNAPSVSMRIQYLKKRGLIIHSKRSGRPSSLANSKPRVNI